MLAVASVAAVGFSCLVGAVEDFVVLDGIIVNKTTVSTVTIGYLLTYAFVVIGAVLSALFAFKNV